MKKFFWVSWCTLLFAGSVAAVPPGTLQFEVREPHLKRYHVDANAVNSPGAAWLRAKSDANSTNFVEMGSRLVLQVQSPKQLSVLLRGSSLQLSRVIATNIFILQAPDASTALREASRLSHKQGVTTCHPVMRRPAELEGPYAPKPNDYWFDYQWYFESRDYYTGIRGAPDLNLRGAWPYTRGTGTTIAICDYGVETTHPDLINRTVGAPHFNFATTTTNGDPPSLGWDFNHGTAVAGLAAATANNTVGVVGAAPEASLASWVIFNTNALLVDDEALMDMFQYQSNVVQIQNHSWGSLSKGLDGPGLLPQIGISDAITSGRNGLGVIMVRSAGNGRGSALNANDNSYRSDPRVICVGSTKLSGRVASYSNPGACLLVAAIGGETTNMMFTTDRQGANGYNSIGLKSPYQPTFDFTGNYGYSFSGSSAAAPQVAGIAALLLSANPSLTYRDVQQILLQSARHIDFSDPDVVTNGAGLAVSHNVGFGIPDAGQAVRLAQSWVNRPAATNLTLTSSNSAAIPDGALRVRITGENVPADLVSIAAAPSTGPHADSPTPILPLIDVGPVTNTNPPSINLTNKAALVEHGTSFSDEITKVAQAGAAFALVFYTSDAGMPPLMSDTDFVPIPAVLIGNTRGLALRTYLQTNGTGMAQIRLDSTNFAFAVSNTLVCEHVGVRLSFNHPARGDLRITLVSPQGTRSVLQRANDDTNAAPTDWTYWSTHHFYESSAGTWTVSVSDEFPGYTGSVESVQLIVQGVPITDTDHDGLDDAWELANFGSLAYGPKDDPDKDGYNNAREQVMGTQANVSDIPLQLDLSRWNHSWFRLSWFSSTNFNYEVWSGTNVANLSLATNIPGQFPETEWLLPATNACQFLRVVALPAN